MKTLLSGDVSIHSKHLGFFCFEKNNKLLDGWLRMGLLPHPREFAYIDYLVEN